MDVEALLKLPEFKYWFMLVGALTLLSTIIIKLRALPLRYPLVALSEAVTRDFLILDNLHVSQCSKFRAAWLIRFIKPVLLLNASVSDGLKSDWYLVKDECPTQASVISVQRENLRNEITNLLDI